MESRPVIPTVAQLNVINNPLNKFLNLAYPTTQKIKIPLSDVLNSDNPKLITLSDSPVDTRYPINRTNYNPSILNALLVSSEISPLSPLSISPTPNIHNIPQNMNVIKIPRVSENITPLVGMSPITPIIDTERLEKHENMVNAMSTIADGINRDANRLNNMNTANNFVTRFVSML